MKSFFQFGVIATVALFGVRHQDTLADFLAAPLTITQHVGVGLEMSEIESALERHRVNYGCYPAADGFEAFMRKNFRHGKKDATLDRWGRPYEYRLPPDQPGFELFSLGPDGMADTDDDLILTRKEGR